MSVAELSTGRIGGLVSEPFNRCRYDPAIAGAVALQHSVQHCSPAPRRAVGEVDAVVLGIELLLETTAQFIRITFRIKIRSDPALGLTEVLDLHINLFEEVSMLWLT